MKGSFHKVSNRNGFGLQARGENKKHSFHLSAANLFK